MASTINPSAVSETIPVEGAASTLSMRNNFAAIKAQLAAAKADIETLEAAIDAVGVGPVGPAGADGADGADGTDTNMITVVHGADPNVARPAADVVLWVGSVIPVNATPNDLRGDTSGA